MIHKIEGTIYKYHHNVTITKVEKNFSVKDILKIIKQFFNI